RLEYRPRTAAGVPRAVDARARRHGRRRPLHLRRLDRHADRRAPRALSRLVARSRPRERQAHSDEQFNHAPTRKVCGAKLRVAPSFQGSARMPAKPNPIVSYLTVSDGDAAIAFYKKAFGAKEVRRHKADDGKRLMHAEVVFNGHSVYLSDDFPE